MRDNHPKTKKLYQYLSDKVTLMVEYNLGPRQIGGRCTPGRGIREMQKKTGITKEYVSRCIKLDQLVHSKYYFSFTSLRARPIVPPGGVQVNKNDLIYAFLKQ